MRRNIIVSWSCEIMVTRSQSRHGNKMIQHLELDHLSLALLLSSQLKVLGSLDWALVLPLAICALQPQHQLLGGLGLLPQDGLGLTSESLLLPIIPTSTLGLLGLGRLLVLSHLHLDVLLAPGAVSVAGLGHVNHLEALYLFPLL